MFLKVILGSIVAVLIGGTYATLYTSAPYQAAFMVMPQEHVSVSEIGGTVMSGISLKDLKINNDYFKFEIQEYKHEVNTLAHIANPNHIKIDAVIAKNAVLEFKPKIFETEEKKTAKNDPNDPEKSEPQDESKKKYAEDLNLIFSIVKMDFKNLKLIVPANPKLPLVGKKEFTLKDFTLDDYKFKFSQKDKKVDMSVAIAKTILKTDLVDLNLKNFIFNKDKFAWDDGAKIVVKKEANELLAGDIDLIANVKIQYPGLWDKKGKGKGNPLNPMAAMGKIKPNVHLSALNDQLNLKIKDRFAIELVANGLTINQFIKTNHPISEIYFKTEMQSPMGLMMGQFPIENARFNIGSNQYAQIQDEPIIDQGMGRMPASIQGMPAGFGSPPKGLKFAANIDEQDIVFELSPSWTHDIIKGLKPSPDGNYHGLKLKYHSQNKIGLSELLQASLGDIYNDDHMKYFESVEQDVPEVSSAMP